MKLKSLNRQMWRYADWLIVLLILALVGYGMLSIVNATADPFSGDESTIAEYMANIDFSYVQKQLLVFGMGVVAIFICTLLDYHSVRNIVGWIYGICVALLVIVLFAGSNQRGTTGWFMIGTYGIQPSEFGKIGLILMLAKVLSDKTEGTNDGIIRMRDVLHALVYFAIPFVLIVIQPDFGTSMVYAFIFFTMLFMAKTHWKIIMLIVAICLALLPIAYMMLQDWQKLRLLSFFFPEDYSTPETADARLQVEQAKMAIGSGGFLGKGLFAPGLLSQLDYVPEKHNDFIFSATVEAFGFLGALILIILYFFLISRTFMLAMRARDDFGAYISVGVAAMTLFHVIENIGMNIDLLPVTGIPLPLFSYGGSSLLTNMIAFGMVISVDMRRSRWPIG